MFAILPAMEFASVERDTRNGLSSRNFSSPCVNGDNDWYAGRERMAYSNLGRRPDGEQKCDRVLLAVAKDRLGRKILAT